MADWTYTPGYPHTIRKTPSETLVTGFKDGTEHRRQRFPSSGRRTFVEEHVVDDATLAAMLAFYDAREELTSFTKVTHDPRDPPATEAKVRFAGEAESEEVAPGVHEITWTFFEVLGE